MFNNIKNKNIGNLNINPKLSLLTIVSLIGMSIIFALFLNVFTKSLYDQRKSQIFEMMHSAHDTLDYFHSLQVQDILTKAKAQEIAMGALKSVTYGNNGYFWLNDSKGVMLMNPNLPELIGKSLVEISEMHPSIPIMEFVNVSKSGGGFVEYYCPKPADRGEFHKISSVILFEDWDWVIGTGIYVDDIENEIESIAYNAIIVILIMFILLILVSMLISKHFFKQMSEIATHDPLTSLLSRRYLSEDLSTLVSSHDRGTKEYLAIIFLDIDFFKNINDTYGHAYGDKVLRHVARSILDSIRVGDLAVRYRGEEFLVAMLCDTQEEAVEVATRIRKLVSKIVFTKGRRTFSVTVSGGIAFRQDGESFEDQLKRADMNLYFAKENGRDKLHY